MPVPPRIPDPMALHPIEGQARIVFLRPLVADSPNVSIGEYTYYDDPDRPEDFLERNVLYAFGPERLEIGRYCALAEGVRFIMPGANHAMIGPSTFPFGIFGGVWGDTTMDLVMSAESRGDTVVGSDVWLGYRALVMPGVSIGHGAVVAAGSVVVGDVPPYAIAGGNPARVLRVRYSEEDVGRLLRAAWWDWPVELVTSHARAIMSGTPAELEAVAEANGLL
jgi:virginiamycin A acetyltransferase